MAARRFSFKSHRAKLGAALIVAAIVAAGTTVAALSTRGSQRISQDTAGVGGSAQVGDFFAASLAIGDFNNDGYGDVIAGVPYEDLGSKLRDAGQIQVLYGSRSGVNAGTAATWHQDSKRVAGRASAHELFGSAVATGDFDNDGYDDALIGVPGEDVAGHRDAGGITVLYGSANGLRGRGSSMLTANSTGVKGEPEEFAHLGASVAVGDFNNDGYADAAVGAPGAGGADSYDAGLVHVFYGHKSGLTPKGDQQLRQDEAGLAGGSEADDLFGASVATGDFDGDGRADLAVGVPGETIGDSVATGAVEIFMGTRDGLATNSAFISQSSGSLSGEDEMDDQFGASLATGDFDGDGQDDLAIGSPGEGSGTKPASGKVHVLHGHDSGLSVTDVKSFSQSTSGIKGKPNAGDEFSLALVAGDFNDNGRVDLAIGVPGETHKGEKGVGAVHVLFGKKSSLSGKRHEWYRPGVSGLPGSPVGNGGFGRSLGAGDIDGDGRVDLVVGTPGGSVGGDAGAGSVTVIYG